METSIEKNFVTRLSYVDLFRALGIVMMIMGHINFGYPFDKYIHAFHMPMFFFCSGFFYSSCNNSKDLQQRVIRKCKSLLVPYFSLALIHFFIISLRTHSLYREALHLLIWNTTAAGFPIAGALWFLTALFLAECIYMILDCLAPNRQFLTIASFSLALFGNFWLAVFSSQPPFGLDAALVGIGFFHFGRMLSENADNKYYFQLLHLNITVSFLFLFLSGILIFMNGYVNLRTASYGNVPLFWLNSFTTILALWNLCRTADGLFSHVPSLHKFVLTIGQDSIIYLGFNQLAILYLSPLVVRMNLPLILQNTIILFLVLIILWFLRQVIFNTKLKILIGK